MPSGFHRPDEDAPRREERDRRDDRRRDSREERDEFSERDRGQARWQPARRDDNEERPQERRHHDGRFDARDDSRIGRGYGKQHDPRDNQRRSNARMYSPRERGAWEDRRNDSGDRETWNRREDRPNRPERDYRDRDDRAYGRDDYRQDRGSEYEDRPFRERDKGFDERRDRYRDDRPPYRDDRYREPRDNRRYPDERRKHGENDRWQGRDRNPRHERGRDDRRFDDRPQRNWRDDRPFDDRSRGYDDHRNRSRGFHAREERPQRREHHPGFDRRDERRGPSRSQEWRALKAEDHRKPDAPKAKRSFKPPSPPNLDPSQLDEPIRLNKFIARSTQYSRRESDDLVKRGRVTVNGKIVGPGLMVKPGDVVLLDEKPLNRRDHLVYILINKPKPIQVDLHPSGEEAGGVPQTIGDLLKFSGTELLHAVASLGEQMMGLQLVSNDPNIDKHFEEQVPKSSYTLALTEAGDADLPARVQAACGEEVLLAEYVDADQEKLSIVVRGSFPADALATAGVTFTSADRLHFAGLTKKDLPRGHWRYLSEREITWVTMFQQ